MEGDEKTCRYCNRKAYYEIWCDGPIDRKSGGIASGINKGAYSCISHLLDVVNRWGEFIPNHYPGKGRLRILHRDELVGTGNGYNGRIRLEKKPSLTGRVKNLIFL